MSTLSPLGVEMLLFPTVAAVSGAGALGVPENLDGESLFASMVTGALTSMHGDGLVHPPSPVGEAALVALPVQTAESFGGGANGVAHSATVIEKTVPVSKPVLEPEELNWDDGSDAELINIRSQIEGMEGDEL